MSHDAAYAHSSADLTLAVDAALECLEWTEHPSCLNRDGVNFVCYACAPDCECTVCDRAAIHLPETLDGCTIEWSPETIEQLHADLDAFIDANSADLDGLDYSQIGQDFILTRNHHGAGFWDRGLGARGDRLTDAARSYGTISAALIHAAADADGHVTVRAIAE